jgi:hypothetical protein
MRTGTKEADFTGHPYIFAFAVSYLWEESFFAAGALIWRFPWPTCEREIISPQGVTFCPPRGLPMRGDFFVRPLQSVIPHGLW